jgi:lysophospholipase L1-like esterase
MHRELCKAASRISAQVERLGRLKDNTEFMPHSFLALGDSYTIGEGVPLYESFPYQTVQLLRAGGALFSAPEIVARTGWTTDELLLAIAGTQLLPSYDFVTLLIGVNNEYRGRDLAEYKFQFEALLQQAIGLAGAKPDRVFVLSIPDWSVTPFARAYLPDAAGRDKAGIACEIDQFNAAAGQITGKYSVSLINITTHARGSAADQQKTPSAGEAASPFASDGLHPSRQEYRYWASQLALAIKGKLPRPY